MPLPAVWHSLCLLITLSQSPNLPTGNGGNAISISKSFCLSPRSLMPSWSPSLTCCLPYAPSYTPEITVSGFIGLPLLCLGTPTSQLSPGMHLSGHMVCPSIQRNQSSFFQKSKLKRINWEPTCNCVYMAKHTKLLQSTLSYQNVNQPCLWQKAFKTPRASLITHLPARPLPPAWPRVPGGTDLERHPK